ncbi:hypothetical protein AB7813_28455 [Tardiphaga sp. 20_F10_N6_6]|uniref:hypothetical protein n=1 Tax=unclassified Tardiphaga TaxID=2631404 RepID=UPI001E28FA70|nr:hypothetical protein [Tardiphaga sp. 37S4]UFS73819.1 hypothetical protein LPB73_18005 [Tardiphaga sp. 37S4]
MSASEDKLEQSYRRLYHRLMIGAGVICAVLMCAIVVGKTAAVPAIMKQIVSGFNDVHPSSGAEAPSLRAGRSCRLKNSWSMIEIAPFGPAAGIDDYGWRIKVESRGDVVAI